MPSASPDRRLKKEVGRFLVIGGSSVAIDLGVYSLLVALHCDAALAKALSYVAGMLFGYFGNKLWTFEARETTSREPIVYVALYATTLAINVGLNAAVLALLGNEARLLAFLFATGVTTVLNFLGLKYATFRTSSLSSASQS